MINGQEGRLLGFNGTSVAKYWGRFNKGETMHAQRGVQVRGDKVYYLGHNTPDGLSIEARNSGAILVLWTMKRDSLTKVAVLRSNVEDFDVVSTSEKDAGCLLSYVILNTDGGLVPTFNEKCGERLTCTVQDSVLNEFKLADYIRKTKKVTQQLSLTSIILLVNEGNLKSNSQQALEITQFSLVALTNYTDRTIAFYVVQHNLKEVTDEKADDKQKPTSSIQSQPTQMPKKKKPEYKLISKGSNYSEIIFDGSPLICDMKEIPRRNAQRSKYLSIVIATTLGCGLILLGKLYSQGSDCFTIHHLQSRQWGRTYSTDAPLLEVYPPLPGREMQDENFVVFCSGSRITRYKLANYD